MHTRFAGLQPPAAFAEGRSIAARRVYLAARAQGASDEAARAAIAAITREPLQIHVNEEEIAAYARLQPGGVDFKQLFCSE